MRIRSDTRFVLPVVLRRKRYGLCRRGEKTGEMRWETWECDSSPFDEAVYHRIMKPVMVL